jgi:signal transduction histidine kinase
MPGPGDQRLLARLAGYEKAGRRFTLLVAEDLAPITQQIARFEWIVAGLLGLALLLVLLVQRYVLRRGFAELDRVRAEIRQVFSGERHRIEELGPSEVRPLSTEVNRLLDQLLKRLQRSRQSLGNLAHALKAPLSLLTRDVETLGLADADHQRLSTRLTQIGELVDRELRRARIAGEGAGRHFVPSRDVPDLLEAVRQLHHERGIEIVAGSLPDATLSFDYDDMIELLGNLLDNACKWATGRVELDVEVADSLAFTVADDGPGVAEDRRDELLQRGGRLDEQAAGHGLGLAIVNDLVDDYGGRLELGRSAALGGLEARVSLPRRQDAVA